MTQEDYVSIETAKLLKEKGFDGECKMKYREHDKKMLNYIPNPSELDYTTNEEAVQKHSEKNHCEYCLCPTLQMAMKWLREKHIVIVSDVETFYADGSVSSWVYHIWCDDNFEENNSVYFKTYQEACEAAIKYCLENLI